MSLLNLKEIEVRIRNFWEANKIPQKLTKFNPKKPKFYLLDGPPYVNAEPHVGHIKTTTLKDVWSKFKLMQGFSVWHQPGFDTHGLPIENMVEKELKIKSKKEIEEIGIEKFIEVCKKKATGNEKVWLNLYKQLGAWRGYQEPYLTYENYYIESAWWTIKRLHEKGLLYQGEKPTYWCTHCQTALAGYEVTDSYADLKDPYIFVKFPIKGKQNEFLVVFTTTPWTLVDNVAIAVHPDADYVKLKVENEIWILAEKRVEKVMELVGKKYEIVEKFKGKILEGTEYEAVLDVPVQNELKNVRRVILSIPVLKSKSYKHGVLEKLKELKEDFEEFVNVEEGTGLVHVAPGHGPEDFFIGQHYNLPVLSEVDDEGRFTEKAGNLKGLYVKDADKLIIEELEKNNLLAYASYVVHSYPLCWRCKNPLIFRLTKQWFLSVEQIKEQMLEGNEKVRWLPSFGKDRFRNWLKDAVDWCISRQRYWGIPLPIWICEKCGKIEVIGSLKELKEKALEKIPKEIDLHKHEIDKIHLKCNNCNSKMERVKDVLDVWFDSGIAPWASLGYPFKNKELFEKLWPVDLVDESQDQIRGWFYSLMFCAVATFGEVPYKQVAMNGWVLDEKGEKMSKSLGNVVLAQEALEKIGADALRMYYCWEVPPWEIQKFSFKTAQEIIRSLNILWNSFIFFLTYAKDFKFTLSNLELEDRWILSRLNSLIKEVTNYLENFEFNRAGRALIEFVINELSRVYIKKIRDRVWIFSHSSTKSQALSVLFEVFYQLAKLFAPITPFLSEQIYQELKRFKKLKQSVFKERWPEPKEKFINRELEADFEKALKIVEIGYAARQKIGLKLRWPLKEILIECDDETKKVVVKLKEIIKFFLNCKQIEFGKGDETYEFAEEKGIKVWVKKVLDEELKMEAFLREFIRNVQEARKRFGFKVDEKIKLQVVAPEGLLDVLKKNESLIKQEVGAEILEFGKSEFEKTGKFNFENHEIMFSFEKV